MSFSKTSTSVSFRVTESLFDTINIKVGAIEGSRTLTETLEAFHAAIRTLLSHLFVIVFAFGRTTISHQSFSFETHPLVSLKHWTAVEQTNLEHHVGIEPTFSAWKADTQPLCQWCKLFICVRSLLANTLVVLFCGSRELLRYPTYSMH